MGELQCGSNAALNAVIFLLRRQHNEKLLCCLFIQKCNTMLQYNNKGEVHYVRETSKFENRTRAEDYV